jgi:RimJ/RimL family protein N-acetyltransferase
MDLTKKLLFTIKSQDCIFRSLSARDVTESYIQALKKQKTYLSNNHEDIDMQWQQKYIENIWLSPADTICGLFINSKLIASAGIQNLNSDKATTIGIFVFDEKSRGIGYGKTLVWASCYLSNNCCNVNYFEAGMERTNVPSLKSFLACGFKIIDKNEKNYKVGLKIDKLQKPNFINKVII